MKHIAKDNTKSNILFSLKLIPTTLSPPKHTEPNQNPKASKAGNVQPNQQIRPHRRPSLCPKLTSSPYPAPTVSPTPIPETPPAQHINVYARTHLPDQTYNHSQRVYHFGLANDTDSCLQTGTWTMRLFSSLVCCMILGPRKPISPPPG